MRTEVIYIAAAVSLILIGCGGPKYACPTGAGVSCKSLSTVYKQSLSGELQKSIEGERIIKDKMKKKGSRFSLR